MASLNAKFSLSISNIKTLIEQVFRFFSLYGLLMTFWESRARPPHEHCYAIFMVGKKRFAYLKRLSLHIYARFHPET